MKYFHLLFILLFLSSSALCIGQNDSLIRVILTTPEKIIADDSTKEIMADYEIACLRDDREIYKDDFDKWAVEMEKENLRLFYQSMRDFLPHLSYENEITFELTSDLQWHSSVKKTNITFQILPYNVGHILPDLEELAEKETADYIIITPIVEFYARKRTIHREPLYYLYDHKLKRIVIGPVDPDFDEIIYSRFSRGKPKSYQLKTYNAFTTLRILSTINPIYQLSKD